MKLKNVKVGMRVFVKNREDSKADRHWWGQVGVVTDPDRKKGGAYRTNFEISVSFAGGNSDIMDAKDVRKLRDGEV